MNYTEPSKEEQELVKKYVLERPLIRPPITYKKASLIFIISFLISICAAIASYYVLSLFGFLFNKLIYIFFFILIEFFIFSKKIAIGFIHLYQHYAPEEVRRRCLLKPTCSEYGILAIRKYGIVIGLIKVWIRLNYKCRGYIYYIDEP